MKTSIERRLVDVDIFEGATGNLVVCQELRNVGDRCFTRVMIPMAEARELAAAILAVAGAIQPESGR